MPPRVIRIILFFLPAALLCAGMMTLNVEMVVLVLLAAPIQWWRIQQVLVWYYMGGRGTEEDWKIQRRAMLIWVLLSFQPGFQFQTQLGAVWFRMVLWSAGVQCFLSCLKPVLSWSYAGKLLMAALILAGDCGRILGPWGLCALLVFGACTDEDLVRRLTTRLQAWELDWLEGFEGELVLAPVVTVDLLLCALVFKKVLRKAFSLPERFSVTELVQSELNLVMAGIGVWHLVWRRVLPDLRRLWALPRATREQLSKYDDVCAVCRMPMTSARSGASCRHLFHGGCLRPLLIGANPRCPLCQTGLFPDPVARR